jgi:hypothetical protein
MLRDGLARGLEVEAALAAEAAWELKEAVAFMAVGSMDMDVDSPPHLPIENSANKVSLLSVSLVPLLFSYLFIFFWIIFSHKPQLRSRLRLVCKERDGCKIQSIVIPAMFSVLVWVIEHLKGVCEDWNGVVLKNKFLHVRCYAHIISHIVSREEWTRGTQSLYRERKN